jgi:hypothetical protein
MFAAVILGDIGEDYMLRREAVDALLHASEKDEEEMVSHWATLGIRRAKQLSRARLQRRMPSAQVGYEALLLRLAEIAESPDLAFFQSLGARLPQLSEQAQHAVVQAVARISSAEAVDMLINLYRLYPKMRVPVAAVLASRKRFDKATLRALANEDSGAASVILKYAGNADDAVETARRLLSHGTFEQRVHGTLIAQLIMDQRLTKELWWLANYNDPRYYPGDAFLRNSALSALLNIEIARAFKRADSKDLDRF